MKIIRNILLFALTVILSAILSYWVGRVYYSTLNITQGLSSFIVPESVNYYVVGFMLTYLSAIIFLFTAFGGSTKYWWIAVLLIPAVIFEIYFDLEHIYIPIVLGLVGWLIGFAISKLIVSLKS